MRQKPFPTNHIIGRQSELKQACQILSADGDMLLAGVPGIGRKTLIRTAAAACHTKVIEIDCLKATSYQRFLNLMAMAFTRGFDSPRERRCIAQWSQAPLQFDPHRCPQLTWGSAPNWEIFQLLLALPQLIAETLNYRVVLVLQNFPHLRSWDKQQQWATQLKHQIHIQPRVSYTLIATVAESSGAHPEMSVLSLKPLAHGIMTKWFTQSFETTGIIVAADAATQFAHYVQGNFGEAIALAQRIRLEHQTQPAQTTIQRPAIHTSAIKLVEDLAVTFESLILLLPPTQIRVLESLALDPTDRPHAQEYRSKHDLSRGGTLQGALSSLIQKGLIYDAEENYRVALPLLALWLKHRLQ
ncbi:ATP-binding protein [filamentous cyanobacterium LEGE 11480]|uniref:ATP-binding protein n=1 Tax=Romeriopsis navalis LEGE 11480 TaxID=2777977 RepID=A0A928Z1N8_9CYAN|nr:ATP-binding protein [Romeriopsis navalis]MBE9028202.1 ATP-binding protein [Romeriopsis navalis LEGE 11480]